MVVAISSDHAGYDLRQQVVIHLKEKGFTVIEAGAESAEKPESYVAAGKKAASYVLSKEADRGIVICGTGLGISMVANKHKGIRCALCTDEFMARMSREHNDANMLGLGARVVGRGTALSIVDAYFATEFEAGGRHQVRVEEIKSHEDSVFS